MGACACVDAGSILLTILQLYPAFAPLKTVEVADGFKRVVSKGH